MTVHSRIAVVEDEPDLRDAVAEYLGANGYEVIALDSAAAMRAAMAQAPVDLAILDISMPGEDGLSLGRWLRSTFSMGIIYATAAGTPIDKVVGLELGGDDYMVKPYELRELLARVRSVLRRLPRDEAGTKERGSAVAGKPRRSVSFGGFTADLEGRILTGPDGSTVEMAKSEFDVLEAFLTRPNRLVTRTALCEAIGLTDDPETSRAVDIRIMRLRRKIEADPASPQFLRTVRGEGYVFSVQDAGR